MKASQEASIQALHYLRNNLHTLKPQYLVSISAIFHNITKTVTLQDS
jgi:hypothetical protein